MGIIERGQLLLSGPIDSVYRQIHKNRHVSIRFNQHVEVGVSILRSRPELRGLEISGHRVTAELQATDEQLADIMQQLIDAGATMHSFNDQEPTLEDVFMMVTKGLVS